MNIAIDYDGTYTDAPRLWQILIDGAEILGHVVYVVTCRHDTPENREEVRVVNVKPHRHIFTGLAAKRWFCEQKGIHIDVWIDDRPETIERGM